jgi:hypothetical protein
MTCSSELEFGMLPPSPTCSLVGRVEQVEIAVVCLRDELRSERRRLTLVVASVSALAPHLVPLCEWGWSHGAAGLLSLLSLLW